MNTLQHKFDQRAQEVLGFLVAKGLLFTNREIKPFYGKIQIQDALWTAEHIEPRVLEVLPAAMIHFPKTFIGIKDIPDELGLIIADIQKRKIPEMTEWRGIQVKNMVKWANKSLKDKRTTPQHRKKQTRTFSLSVEAGKKLKELSKSQNRSETEILEKLLLA